MSGVEVLVSIRVTADKTVSSSALAEIKKLFSKRVLSVYPTGTRIGDWMPRHKNADELMLYPNPSDAYVDIGGFEALIASKQEIEAKYDARVDLWVVEFKSHPQIMRGEVFPLDDLSLDDAFLNPNDPGDQEKIIAEVRKRFGIDEMAIEVAVVDYGFAVVVPGLDFGGDNANLFRVADGVYTRVSKGDAEKLDDVLDTLRNMIKYIE